jgi:uncharacterized protein YutE (UPF0331/DUF86 family)
MIRIAANDALTLAAFIRSDLEAIARIENQVSQFDPDNLSPAELDSLGYSMHNIYNALENCFDQVSRNFEGSGGDQTRWHRELLDKMFLEIKLLRHAVLPEEARSVLGELLGFRHVFRHGYNFKLDKTKTVALWNRWSVENGSVKQALTLFADELEQIGSES